MHIRPTSIPVLVQIRRCGSVRFPPRRDTGHGLFACHHKTRNDMVLESSTVLDDPCHSAMTVCLLNATLQSIFCKTCNHHEGMAFSSLPRYAHTGSTRSVSKSRKLALSDTSRAGGNASELGNGKTYHLSYFALVPRSYSRG